MTDSNHVTSTPKAAVFRRVHGFRGGVAYSAAAFSKERAVVSGGKLTALLFYNSYNSKKYIITSLAGRESRISATSYDDAIACNASPIASQSVTYRANPPP